VFVGQEVTQLAPFPNLPFEQEVHRLELEQLVQNEFKFEQAIKISSSFKKTYFYQRNVLMEHHNNHKDKVIRNFQNEGRKKICNLSTRSQLDNLHRMEQHMLSHKNQ